MTAHLPKELASEMKKKLKEKAGVEVLTQRYNSQDISQESNDLVIRRAKAQKAYKLEFLLS